MLTGSLWSAAVPCDFSDCQAEVYTLERVSDRIKEGIRDIDSRVTRISQTATRVGDRLQVGYWASEQSR